MRIRVDGQDIFDKPDSMVEVVIGEKDTLQLTTPAADLNTCVYVMSYDNCKLSMEGGASIVDNSAEALVLRKSIFEIRKHEGKFVLNGEVLSRDEMYHLSIPMVPRIMRQLLDNNGVKYEYVKSVEVEIFSVDIENNEMFENIVKQCIQYRCSQSADEGRCEILRQLPIRIAIAESDKLIAIGKKHAIYTSSRGGYNIKVKDYTNSSLDSYYYYDSKMWD